MITYGCLWLLMVGAIVTKICFQCVTYCDAPQAWEIDSLVGTGAMQLEN